MTISPALFPAVTVTVVRDRKIRTALRTNQNRALVENNKPLISPGKIKNETNRNEDENPIILALLIGQEAVLSL